ncbi:MAG TPA: HDOD domain-containing protein [Candidatus Acidoferrales bacterium]|nr:HDOD domain-containing protein [Candidatus Acidoferrales bacterium]
METLRENRTEQSVASKFLRYAARQPILTADQQVYGYELLFRDSLENSFTSNDPDAASRNVLDSSILMGLDVLCDGRRAFINCTRDLLLRGYITLLPPNQTAVEILETVQPDELVISTCRRLKDSGYLIALDDFSENDPREPLVEVADVIKIDMRATSMDACAALVKRYATPRRRLLAEKTETREEFQAARKAGFSYFQGYFFRKPEIVQAREIPANRVNYLRLLQAISQPEADPHKIEEILKGEASLCYRLLRYLNSPIFGFRQEVKSVRHALTILGDREMRRWIRLVTTLTAAQNKPTDLILTALTRARFCEMISTKINRGSSDLFLVGLLSVMDAILEMPMGLVLDGIAVEPDTRAVLLGEQCSLTPIYDLMLAQEAGEWSAAERLSEQLHLANTFAADVHWSAMQWASEMTSDVQ